MQGQFTDGWPVCPSGQKRPFVLAEYSANKALVPSEVSDTPAVAFAAETVELTVLESKIWHASVLEMSYVVGHDEVTDGQTGCATKYAP